jgi:hypothetical protein
VSRRDLTRAALAVALFFAGWAALHVSWVKRGEVSDLPVYEHYGSTIEAGEVPYADFGLEYPPLALPMFAAPSLLSGSDAGYRRAFEAQMASCGALLVLLAASILARLGATERRRWLALGAIAILPLLLGPVVLTRFDLWPALLTLAALAALVRDRDRLGAGLLGAAVAAKLYPVVLLPLLAAWLWRRRGRRQALVGVGIALAVPLLAYLPFALLSPGGVADSVVRQLDRPLQIESLGAAALMAAHQLFGYPISWSSGHGSQNLDGLGALPMAILTSLVQVALLVWAWRRFALGPAEQERLLRYSAAAVGIFIAFGKVLSPQFLIWVLALVPLVAGRRGLLATGLLALACALTQVWFPRRYWEYVKEFDPLASWAVFSRDVALVALVAVLVWPMARGREPARSP